MESNAKALDRLYGDYLENRPELPGATASSLYEERLLVVYRSVRRRWPSTMSGMAVEPLSLHDVQFSLREWDKYERHRLSQGRGRKYGEETI